MERDLIARFKNVKKIQLVILILLELIFLTILICNPNFIRAILDNRVVCILCILAWIMALYNIGCLIHDLFRLRSFATEVHALSKAVYLDEMTGVLHRQGLEAVFRTYDTPEKLSEVGCLMITISNLKEINSSQGYSAGNKAIRQLCNILEVAERHNAVVGRNSGNDFIILMNRCSEENMTRCINEINERLDSYNGNSQTPLAINHAYILNSQLHATHISQILTATYDKLYS